MKRSSSHYIPVLFIIPLLFSLGCAMANMESRWRDRDITIDGIDNGPEWEYARYFIDKQQVTLGIMNDDDAVYLRLSSRDTAVQRTVLTGGLTIWFDESGGKKKTFGVRYPMGVSANDTIRIPGLPSPAQGDGMRRGGFRGGAVETEAIENAVNGMIAAAGYDLEIIGAGADSTLISGPEAAGYGIEHAIAYSAGNLVYELRIPLQRKDGNRFGISTNGGIGSFAIGFETGRVPEPEELLAGRADDSDAGNRMNPDDPDYEDDGMLMNTRRTRQTGGMRPAVLSAPLTKTIDMWLLAHLASEK